METVQIQLEKHLLDKAIAYAKLRGIDLSTMLTDYLSRLVKQQEEKSEIPDGSPVDETDLNGREAYHRYLEEKYR